MSKKFFYFLLTIMLVSSLASCSKTGTTPTSTSNSPVSNSSSTSTDSTSTNPSNASGTSNQTTNSANPATNSEAKHLIPVNIPVSPDVKLPSDIPVFPNAKPVDKRQTNKIITFIFSTDAQRPEVENFYKDILKREGWIQRIEQQNVADGYFFTKPKRTLRVVAYKDGQLNKTVFRLSFFDAAQEENSTMEIMGEDGKLAKRVTAADLSQVGRMPNIMSSMSIYPGAEKKASEKPGMWWEYKSKDPVKKIAEWYDKDLKTKGWSLEQDNSELGDSMMIYGKKDEKGDKINVAIRINDMKDKTERWITIINYPYNAVIPDLDPISKVEKEQPEAAKVARDIAKKNQAKNSQSDGILRDVTPEMRAEVAAKKQALQEKQKAQLEEKIKAKEKAMSEKK